ncbi:SgcJ/EcaC family oxidoreductase [Affinibrenneria salicis]|uniref:SgcJ/EcaC family oxidoreductase n=1 Tax=Affinibrenneria salicis TaxID=2590031 RepID=A0A5J5G3V0_9GAMM|nr:SgcJ/EcaC family oxidoreductase [Affinibrenneria salicis]KAA9001698.1 SgcJ/EcaC family oxidoreductase [Affinibrenneria salicis]
MEHPIKALIKSADSAISREDFDSLLNFYTDDAVLVIKPGLLATGKEQIRKAFITIAAYFNHSIEVRQGKMELIESGDSALVIMETLLNFRDADGGSNALTRRATYVFRKDAGNRWLCAIDNSYGTDLLDVPPP